MIIQPKQIFTLTIGSNKRIIGIYKAIKLIDRKFIEKNYDSICFNNKTDEEIEKFLIANKFAQKVGECELYIGNIYNPIPEIKKL